LTRVSGEGIGALYSGAILIIEDEAEFPHTHRDVLISNSHEALKTQDGEADGTNKTKNPGLILLDLVPLKFHGFGV